MHEVRLPELGEGIAEATVAELHCAVGKPVQKDDDLLEVVTDKATFNITAEVNGVVEKICVTVGDQPKIGEPLLIVKEA